ncbi:LOW QUALITY PROTEIN: STX4 isoform 1, partial [Pongo abelii]
MLSRQSAHALDPKAIKAKFPLEDATVPVTVASSRAQAAPLPLGAQQLPTPPSQPWARKRRDHGDDSSDEEDKERVALVLHPGTARLGSPDEEFFQKVRTIRQTIVKLGNKVQELEKQQVTILATPLPEEGMKQELQNLRDEIKQLGREIRLQLKAIEPQKEEADENYNSINTRMR